MYLIDGHNLIGSLPDLSLSDPDDEAKLVLRLIGFAARTGKKICVIFDRGVPAGRSRLGNAVVEVVFANPVGTADALMIRRIRDARHPQDLVVVSSDRGVLAEARARKLRTFTSPEFAAQLATPAPPARSANRGAASAPDKPSDVYVSKNEVEYWIKRFSERGDRR
jgi:hypothetical protein